MSLPIQKPDAPRLRAYLERREGKRLLRMPRSEWKKAKPQEPGEVLVDVRRTPMAKVESDALVIAATAQQVSSSDAQIRIYRYDPADAKPINVDAYSVWEDLPSLPDFPDVVAAADTDYDDNMKEFLEENVFIVPKELCVGHWLDEEELPFAVRYLIPAKGSSGAG